MQGSSSLLLLLLLAFSQTGTSWVIPHNHTNSTLPAWANSTLPASTGTLPAQSTAVPTKTNQTAIPSAVASLGAAISSLENNATINAISANLQALNPQHATCDLNSETGAQQWANTGGDQVFATAMTMYKNNVLICGECFGMTKDQCKSKSGNCQSGLKDLAQDGHVDSAMARLANDTSALNLDCQVGSGACDSAPACQDVQTPAMWAIRTSLTTLHNQLTTVYTAMTYAQANASVSMDAFESYFAPVPTDSSALFGKIMEAIITCMFGIAGPLLEGAEAGVKTAVKIASTLDKFGQSVADSLNSSGGVSSGSPKTWLPTFAQAVITATANASNSLFHTGQSATSGGATLADAMQDGKLLSPNTSAGASLDSLSRTFLKLLFQQLAVFTWTNLQKDQQKHYPFIAFDTQTCDKVDAGKSMFGALGQDVGVTYQGACYYLLDATALVEPGEVSVPMVAAMPTIECHTAPLPGGTNKGLQGQTLFGGLALEDFVIPAVESWIANGKKNGAQPASFSAGTVPTSIQQAGAVTLPVCDYTAQKGTGGKDCPNFAGNINRVTDGCVISS